MSGDGSASRSGSGTGRTPPESDRPADAPGAGSVLSGIGDAVLGVDAEARIQYVDERAPELLGTPDLAAGTPLAEALPVEEPAELQQACRRALERGRPRTVEARGEAGANRFEFRIHPDDPGATVVVVALPATKGPPDGPTRDETGSRDDWSALRDLCSATAAAEADFETTLRRLLEVGRDYLGVADGMLIEVDRTNDSHRVALTTADPETVPEGTETDLSATYCQEAVSRGGLVGVHDAEATGYADHPSYADLGLACYLGGSVHVGGELYGTVCFVDQSGRSAPFSERERTFVGLLVDWIGRELERRSREHELERYRTIVETVDDGIYALDGDDRFTFVNRALAKMTGYDPETILGRHASFLSSETATEEANRIQEHIEAGAAPVGVMETEFTTSEGVSVPVENRFAPYTDEDGRTGRVGVARNVSERKSLERKLRGLQATARELADARDEADVCRRAVGACRSVLELDNAGIWRLEDGEGFELVVETADGVGVSRLPVDEATAREVVRTGVPELLSSSDDLSPDRDRCDRTGSAVVVPVGDYGVLASVADQAGRFVSRDVDLLRILAANTNAALERARRELDLRATREELRRSNQQLEQFAYAASHDLREPLRMVSNYLGLLERRYGDDLDEEAMEYVEYAVDGSDRLQEMIRGLLAYSRIRGSDRDHGPVDMNDVTRDALRNLEVRIEETGAEVAVGDLPAVRGDRSQLTDVVQNLVSNALEYSGDGRPAVEVSAREVDGGWAVSVSDEGIGMDRARSERAFDLFERLDRTGQADGTGIGLALCEEIVEEHGGDIHIDSEPGAGTTVTFTLPAASSEGESVDADRIGGEPDHDASADADRMDSDQDDDAAADTDPIDDPVRGDRSDE